MRTRFSRPLVAAAAVAALGCVAACGAGGDADAGQNGKSARSKAGGRTDDGEKAKTPAEGSQDAEDPQDTGGTGDTQDTRDSQDTGGPQGSSGGAPKSAGPLTKAQLKKAALATDDVKGFEVKESEGADLLGQTVPATPSKCQPIADMFLFSTDPASRAGVSRGAVSKDETNASVITFALLAYKSGEADEVIDGLRSATKGCTAYRHADYDYKNVKAAADPGLGDESVAFRLVASIEGAQVPAAYTVVRDGTTLVAFSSMNMLDADDIEVPAKLVKAQLAKLAKLAKTTG